jgi:hypothetical protein
VPERGIVLDAVLYPAIVKLNIGRRHSWRNCEIMIRTCPPKVWQNKNKGKRSDENNRVVTGISEAILALNEVKKRRNALD